MLDVLKVLLKQGNQAIPNIKRATVNTAHRGFPELQKCDRPDCEQCRDICPSQAISDGRLSIDLGKCVFCGDCQRACPDHKIQFTNAHKIAADKRNFLQIESGMTAENYENFAIQANREIKHLLGHSLKLRQVSAGGCGGCELELNACGNVNFDMGRFGIDFTASPRHADGIVITGPITENMAYALNDTYRSIPDPKITVLAGSCAISGGVFASSPALNRDFLNRYPVDLYVPGCPIHPLTFINGILNILGR